MAIDKTTIVVSIAGQSPEQMINLARSAIDRGGQGIELRLDALGDLQAGSVKDVISVIRKVCDERPIIATCRQKSEGGLRDHPVQVRLDAYRAAVDSGANWIDIEFASYLDPAIARQIDDVLAHRPSTRLILSCHSWNGPFEDIMEIYKRIGSLQPRAVPKLVYMANHITDCFQAIDLLRRTDRESILFCMGQAGLMSRVLAGKLGSIFTYASCNQAVAPGQIPVDQIKGLYRADMIGSETKVYGLVGEPVGHSIGPVIHNTGFAKVGLDAVYLPLLVGAGRDGFFRFMDQALARPWLCIRGLSITLPHKQHALEFVKARSGHVEPLAERIGAVNTLLIDHDGRIMAYNTDYLGAISAIYSVLNIEEGQLKGWPVAVIGAGGAARAVVAGLADAGAKVTIYNRTLSKAQALASEFGCGYAPLDDISRSRARLLVNCTSVGMYPDIDRSPVSEQVLEPGMVVFDTVYNPMNTRLLQIAAQRGCRCIDGLWMYAYQAAAQFKLFTGQQMDLRSIREVARRHLVRS